MYRTIAIAGTFDRLHKGHWYFISESFKRGKKVIIGLTSDEYILKFKVQSAKCKATRNLGGLRMQSSEVEDYIMRRENLIRFLKQKELLERAEIVKIDDIYGPAVKPAKGEARDNEIEVLVVTSETLQNARLINRERKLKKLKLLKILEIPLVRADDGKRISSSRIRAGEIDRWGREVKSPQHQSVRGRRQSKVKSTIQSSKVRHAEERDIPYGRISETLRQALKKPQGLLIKGDLKNPRELVPKLKKLIRKTQPTLISTVGDEATKLCNEVGIAMNLAVVDYKVRRVKVYKSLSDLGFLTTNSRFNLEKSVVTVRNPAGNITRSLVKAIKKAYLICHPERIPILHQEKRRIPRDSSPAKGGVRMTMIPGHPFPFIIRVIGEEDLAGVPAILFAPKNTLVLYGQPQKGLVVVEVTKEKKEELMDLIENN